MRRHSIERGIPNFIWVDVEEMAYAVEVEDDPSGGSSSREDIRDEENKQHVSPQAIRVRRTRRAITTGIMEVGRQFQVGKLYLPQLMRAVHVAKLAMSYLSEVSGVSGISAISAISAVSAVSGGGILGGMDGVGCNLTRSVTEANQMIESRGKILLATVTGDVNEIGKSIVGVVLACNNYEIIDAGVGATAEEIIDLAIENQVNVVGLSGLITPALDAMVHVATEMQRSGLCVPLLIGGAATSRTHTATKIAPR